MAPPNWHRTVLELDVHNESNNGYKNEDLIVWMRAAAFPSFRKFYRRVDHASLATMPRETIRHRPTAAEAGDEAEEEEDQNDFSEELFASGLPAGNYTLTVSYGM